MLNENTLFFCSLLSYHLSFAGLSDLNFMPLSGEKNFKIKYHTHHEFYGQEEAGGTQDNEVDTEKESASLSFGYGLNDKMALELIITYRIKHTITTDTVNYQSVPRTYSSTENKLDTLGIEDPVMYLGYRAFNQNDLTIDLNTGALLSIGDSDDDNSLRGGHVIKLGTELSKKINTIELYAAIALDINFEAKNSDGNTTEENSQDLTLRLAMQYMAFSNFFLKLELSHQSIGSKGDNQDSYTLLNKEFALSYLFTPSFFTSINYNMIDNSKINDIEGVYDQEESEINIQLSFLF